MAAGYRRALDDRGALLIADDIGDSIWRLTRE
jgi:hypothetical protein